MAKKFNSEEFIKSRVWSTSKLESVSEITLKAVTDYIWSQMNKKKEQEFVRAFVRENLKRGDTLITFNWDLTLERALEDLPGDPGFLYTYSRHRKNKEFSLLKPHGSVDWFETKRLRGLGYEKEVDKHDKQLCYYPEFNLGRTPKLKEIAPVIVPPVSAKEFKYDFLKRTWRWVYKAISSATEIHIIGYSLPKEDQFARLVFRRAIRNNILTGVRRTGDPPRIFVANPDGTVEQTFSSIVGRQIPLRFLQAYFEDIAEDYKTLIR